MLEMANDTTTVDLEKCSECGGVYHGSPRCPTCGEASSHTVASAGTGTLYTWTTTWRAFSPDGPPVPYTVGIVELEEGPRVHGLIQTLPEFVYANMPLRLASLRVDEGGIAFGFEPAGTAEVERVR